MTDAEKIRLLMRSLRTFKRYWFARPDSPEEGVAEIQLATELDEIMRLDDD